MDVEVDSMSARMDALLKNLGELLEQEYALLCVIRRDTAAVLSGVRSSIRDMIHLCEPLHEPCIRELFYDVEDWVDLFALRVHVIVGGSTAPSSRILRWLRLVRRMLPIRRVFASEFRELRERITEASKQRNRYRLAPLAFPCVPVPRPVDPRLTTRSVNDSRLVGFDGPMEEVTKMVTGAGGKAKLKIVSIVGMAGSEKTTLAAAVYGQLRQQNCFQLHAFVSVEQKPDMVKQALNSMLSELGDGHQEEQFEDITELDFRLRKLLENKRYLIVVDDLWSRECWENIQLCFPENSLGSTIIITTRNLALAMECSCGSSDCIYNIGLLNEVDSRKLILDRAFGIGHGFPQHLEDVFAHLTRRCGGLPLALIMAAGNFLENRFSKDEFVGPTWLLSSSPHAENMKHTLHLSYNDLPPHLKKCLLYLSTFPWNTEVDVDRLTRRWNAEGFILKENGVTVEQIARFYLNELTNRNMVSPLFLNKDGIKCCRLHPVIHDFIVCKSMEENFATPMDVQRQDVPSTSRRLCLQSSSMQDQVLSQQGVMNLSCARLVTIFGQVNAAPWLTNLKVVRVLDLEGCVGPLCLDFLGKLLLLRYLSLKGTDVSELPETIGDLRLLQTLDVRSTKVKELPRSITRLQPTIETLLVSGQGMVNSIGEATSNPDKLAVVDFNEHLAGFVKVLGDLNRLRELEITWPFHQCTLGACCKALLSSMQKWSQLRSLTMLCGGVGCCMEFLGSLSHQPELLEKFKVTGGGFVSVPKWIQRLDRLSFLQITICKIETDDLNLLRNLPQLECLILGLDFVPRNAIVIESYGFSNLLRFSVDCPVAWLAFETGAMPMLTYLQLEFCSGWTNPESVPSGISNLQRLTEVVLLYNQKWCADSSSVRMTVEAVKRQVVKHRNMIDLIINDTKVDVQEVDVEMKNTTEIQSGNVGEETARTTVETQGEIEIEAECDNISSTLVSPDKD